MNLKITFLIYFVVIIVILSGCAIEKLPHQETRVLLGSYVTIKVQDVDKNKIEKITAVNKAFNEIKRIEDLLSSFKRDDMIDKINNSGTKEIFLDEDTFYVLKKAKYFNKVSKGAFDITVLPLLELWGFHGRNYSIPSEEKIKEVLDKTGSDKMILDKKKRSVRFLIDGMRIDLGGIAKGYAVDRAALVLKENGIKNALVDAGGDIYCFGERQKGKKWSVGIRDPDPMHKDRVMEQIDIEDSAVDTSGGYENFFEAEGKRYSHIIDPKTGRPVENDVISVTIIAKDCMTADALATAVVVMGKDKGVGLIKRLGNVNAVIITKEGKRLVFQKVR